MSDAIGRQSPLVRFDLPSLADAQATTDATITVAERAFLGHLNLRGDSNDARFVAATEQVLGFGLPLEPNTVAHNNDLIVCWLGPNEWLVITAGERERAIADELRGALDGVFSAVTELSGGQTVLVLEGSAVRDVLARGCTLDLHPRVFGPGRCAQTLFGKAPVLLRQVNDTPRFELVVRRSFADYVWALLIDASRDESFKVVRELP